MTISHLIYKPNMVVLNIETDKKYKIVELSHKNNGIIFSGNQIFKKTSQRSIVL